MDISIESILRFIETHHQWAGVIFGLMAFGESMVVIGVLIPATTVMLAAGTLVGAGVLSFWDLFVGGAIGAALGDAVSYWLGLRLGPASHRIWPFSRNPGLLAAAENVFARWGWAAVFFGRFIGPLRASVPLVAGMLGMPNLTFQVLNLLSAMAWIPVLIAPGAAASVIYALVGEGRALEAGILGGLVIVGGVVAWWLIRRKAPTLAGHANRPAAPDDRSRPDETNGR